jgi:hypothetical protein
MFGNTVSRMALKIRPDKFVGIKLRRIRRERISDDAAMVLEESFDSGCPMNHAPVPEKNKAFPKVPKQKLQKEDNFLMTNVAIRMETDIQLDTPSMGRYADSRDSRNLCPMPGAIKNRRFSAGSPCPTNIRDQRESAFIEKDERDATPSGVFLYAATQNASNVLSPSRCVPLPAWLASDNSSPFPGESTRYDWGDRLPQNFSRLPRRFFESSRDPWNSRSLRPLSEVSGLNSVSYAYLALRDVPVQVLPLVHQRHSFYALRATGEPSLLNNRFSRQQPADLILVLAVQQRAGGAAQAAFGFHMVSWNHNNIFIGIFLLLLRNSIVAATSRVKDFVKPITAALEAQ